MTDKKLPEDKKATKERVVLKYDDLKTDKLLKLIENKESFDVIDLNNMLGAAIRMVETEIERKGMRCRVYTKGRVASAGATVLGGPGAIAGLTSMAGIAVHNLATLAPDYEIAKHLINKKLTVKYKK